MHDTTRPPILIIGAGGKTGRRVAEKLTDLGHPVRRASRSGETRFDWDDPSTWAAAVEGVDATYVVYSPDLAVPAAPPAIRAFATLARENGVRRLVLLSGRGEEEAQRCERIVQEIDPAWTVVRAAWFNQNFDESFFMPPLREGTLALPARAIAEPFVDCNDIADVAVAALTEAGHAGEIYEVTGPRALTFHEIVAEIGKAAGRKLRFVPVPFDAFADDLRAQQTPEPVIELMRYLFGTVLDGRNSSISDGVQRALGRPPKDFAEFARDAAASGVWNAPATEPEQVMRRFVDEFLNGGDETVLEELVHDDYVYRSPGEELRGREGLTTLFRGYRGAFPDLRIGVDDLVVAADATVLSFTLTGTHRGELLGIPATGERVKVRGMVRSRFRDGKIADEWEILDTLSLFEQLGVVGAEA